MVTLHSAGHSWALRRRLRAPQGALLRPLLERAAKLIAVSAFEARAFSDRLGIARDRFEIVPNGAELPDGGTRTRFPGLSSRSGGWSATRATIGSSKRCRNCSGMSRRDAWDRRQRSVRERASPAGAAPRGRRPRGDRAGAGVRPGGHGLRAAVGQRGRALERVRVPGVACIEAASTGRPVLVAGRRHCRSWSTGVSPSPSRRTARRPRSPPLSSGRSAARRRDGPRRFRAGTAARHSFSRCTRG